ncbi:metallophosphoesterase family protein [Adhaeribacter aquaticus]|uniref:metallophosphoesterase family protein n=1 Tax=Adhaeribacter aquaticus TaxID=299567 RepID=UPI000425E893|nr:metallophosphoesterase [Adhaeribacter aquaticus]
MKQVYFYQRTLGYLLVLVLLFMGVSCDPFDYSPNEVLLASDEKNLNQKNIDKITALGITATDTLRIALISDTQRFYDETKKVVNVINDINANKKSRIHFVIHGGDISDFGLLEEYRWQHQILKKLAMPYVVVLGNHDCVANGKKVYRNMYGPYDFSFQVGANRFVFMNTNTMEFESDIPLFDYMENSLKDVNNYKNAFIVSHVAPYDPDYNRAKEEPFASIVRNYKVKYSIHGHQHTHSFKQPYNDNQNYLIIGSVEKQSFVLMTIIGEKVTYEVIKF